ncbi:high-potential iron-sulfur protein [Silvimonas iriomotensis]|uniref:High-potential iron-sulfur protein n=1 Tax=Silvimonas iriomotensis TaxID=449662 RepID=A0ABQ2P4I4_9NEIS|nr:high-potential iron-sulfur protein [Silvimonas iriomotensis]GGP18009.1 high-potential iron-sulfur protein [Silvimonas iriomotensis]
MTSRRTFLFRILPATAAALALARPVLAADPELAESDPDAIKLAYAADASKVDKARNPTWAAGQRCDTCELFNAPDGGELGACSLIKGKLVRAGGWCNQYVM